MAEGIFMPKIRKELERIMRYYHSILSVFVVKYYDVKLLLSL